MLIKRMHARLHHAFFRARNAKSDNPLIGVVIPLISKERADDWGVIVTNLRRTIRSLEAQTYSNFVVVICGQDAPHELLDGARVTFLEATKQPSASVSDKKTKLSKAFRHLGKSYPSMNYVAVLDADDLFHPRLFEHVAQDNNASGYLMDLGYFLNLESGSAALIGHEQIGAGFSEHCGSCAIFAVDFTRRWLSTAYLQNLGAAHQHYLKRSASFGYPLASVPFASVVYVINHGENMRKKRGKDAYKASLAEQYAIDGSELAEFRALFPFLLDEHA